MADEEAKPYPPGQMVAVPEERCHTHTGAPGSVVVVRE